MTKRITKKCHKCGYDYECDEGSECDINNVCEICYKAEADYYKWIGV